MRSAGGYSIITEPNSRPREHDTYTCAHCGFITFTRAGFGPLQVAVVKADATVVMQNAGFCQKCYKHICPKCERNPGCEPYEKKVEAEERLARKLILP